MPVPGGPGFLDGRREVAQGAGINQSVAQHAEYEKDKEQLCPGFLYAQRKHHVCLLGIRLEAASWRRNLKGGILNGGILAAIG